MSDLVAAVKAAMVGATRLESKLPPEVLAIEGMSGRKYRHFINNLIAALERPRYLEVGVWQGSTLCSALYGNWIQATAIDNWSQFGGPKDRALENIYRWAGVNYVDVRDADFRMVDYAALGAHDVYLFDGPHEERDQYDGIVLAQPALAHEFVLIVDDWNWPQVRAGTFCALRDLGLTILYDVQIRTTQDDTHPAVWGAASDWHNGYCVAVLRRVRDE